MNTYKDPGNCPKCDSDSPTLDWDEQGVTTHNRSLGVLWAVCLFCRYRWEVQSKDQV